MPETSAKTRILVVDQNLPCPTVIAFGAGDSKYSQVYLEDSMAGRRLKVSSEEPAPTIMAGASAT